MNVKAHLTNIAIEAIRTAMTSQTVCLECHDCFLTLRFGNKIILQCDAHAAIAVLLIMGDE